MEAEGEDPAAIAVLQFILQQTPPPPHVPPIELLPPAAAAASAGHGLQFRHLVRRCVLSLLDGCWGQTRYAGGPTQAQLRGCLSFSWPSRPGGYALTW